MAADRLREDVIPTGARVVVTPCPSCILNLRDASRQYGLGVEVIDLTDLICRALRI